MIQDFSSDAKDPLTFEVVEGVGYRFIEGIGSVTTPDGEQVDLYRPTGAAINTTVEDSGECHQDDGQPAEYLPLKSPSISHEVVIDGEINSEEEWNQAYCIDLRLHEGLDYGRRDPRFIAASKTVGGYTDRQAGMSILSTAWMIMAGKNNKADMWDGSGWAGQV